jgi:hypothetical protein
MTPLGGGVGLSWLLSRRASTSASGLGRRAHPAFGSRERLCLPVGRTGWGWPGH